MSISKQEIRRSALRAAVDLVCAGKVVLEAHTHDGISAGPIPNKEGVVEEVLKMAFQLEIYLDYGQVTKSHEGKS